MVRCKVGDYVTYKMYDRRRRGVVTQVCEKYVWIRCVAECIGRKWREYRVNNAFKHVQCRVLNVLPPHKAAVYKLKGL
jgi:hypothetical protein